MKSVQCVLHTLGGTCRSWEQYSLIIYHHNLIVTVTGLVLIGLCVVGLCIVGLYIVGITDIELTAAYNSYADCISSSHNSVNDGIMLLFYLPDLIMPIPCSRNEFSWAERALASWWAHYMCLCHILNGVKDGRKHLWSIYHMYIIIFYQVIVLICAKTILSTNK